MERTCSLPRGQCLVFRPIDTVALSDGVYKLLDLKEEIVKPAIFSATSARLLYDSAVAEKFLIKLKSD